MKLKYLASTFVFLVIFSYSTNIYSAEYSLLRNKIIVIDPGHGGRDPGAVANGVREADVTLAVALKLRDKLVRSGATVILTRAIDRKVARPGTYLSNELQARVDIAEISQADIFISLHANSTRNSRICGAISFFPNGRSNHLARSIQQSLIKETHAVNEGIRSANFYVLKKNIVPATLIEIGFLTNPTEAFRLKNAVYQNQLADGIFNGIYCYFRSR
jgi:N-acetylmuramoyl-L-alanine amidase